MKLIKKFIIPIIIIILFCIGYFIIYPMYISHNASKTIFQDFEKYLSDLNINYEKEILDASIYGAKKAYAYTANDKTVKIYIYSKNSDIYKQATIDGYVQSSIDEEAKLYGVFANNCALYMESEFPKDKEILNIFMSLSEEYSKNI